MPMLKKREDLTESKDNNTMFALGLSDDFGGFFSLNNEENTNKLDYVEDIDNLELDEETKYKVLNEYNNYKNSKSIKEKEKYKKRIDLLLKS